MSNKKVGELIRSFEEGEVLVLESWLKVNVSFVTISHIENGKVETSKETLRQIARALNYDIDKLYSSSNYISEDVEKIVTKKPEIVPQFLRSTKDFNNKDWKKLKELADKISKNKMTSNASISNIEIEERANNLLSNYFERYKKPFKGPIPVDHILEFLGYDIEFKSDGIYKDKNILGGLLLDKKIVQINESISNQNGRLNFTIAHEIGHILLHSRSKHSTDDKKDSVIGVLDNRKIELEADKFASNLLMPTNIVKTIFFENYKNSVVLKSSLLDILEELKKDLKASKIASKIQSSSQLSNVSKLAVLNKLIDLKLVTKFKISKHRI